MSATQHATQQTLAFNFLEAYDEVKLYYLPKVKNSQRPKITTSADVFNLVLSTWKDIDHYESFKVLLLNRANRVLGIKTISTGGVSGTVADCRLIFQAAILANASGVCLLHNHPSGNTKPSEADKALTKKVKEGGILLEIPILDHVIITSESYFSFADEGLL